MGWACVEATIDAVGGAVPPPQADRKATASRAIPTAARFIRRIRDLIVKIIPAFPALHPYRKLSPPGLLKHSPRHPHSPEIRYNTTVSLCNKAQRESRRDDPPILTRRRQLALQAAGAGGSGWPGKPALSGRLHRSLQPPEPHRPGAGLRPGKTPGYDRPGSR